MIALFIPCVVDQFFPEAGEATADLIEGAGLDADYPADQTCCGLPFYNMGHWDAARPLARRFLDIFEGYEAVVTPSSSCAAMVKHFFPNLFEDDPESRRRSLALAERTHELTMFLSRVLKRTQVGAKFEGTIACHPSCHLRELGGQGEAEELIRNVEGAKLLPLPRAEMCCGFGGSFAVKFPVLSGAMGDSKCQSLADGKADLIVTTDGGCMMQINGLLSRAGGPRRVRHIAELLAGRL